MRVSPLGKMIATADTLGKIKLVEFPNIYNMLTVFLYNNEDIKFCDFLNNQNLIVINSNYEIHLWDLNDFKLKNKFDLKTILNIKIQEREETLLVENKEENDGNKKNVEAQENSNFCREDEIIKNVFFVKGKNIVLQIRENVRKLKDDQKINFVVFEISNSDEISYKESKLLNEVSIDENTHILISDLSNDITILNLKEENNQSLLNTIANIKIDELC